MSSLKICLICLRTDVELRKLNYNLSDFYEDLCDYTCKNSTHLSCSVCESMLNKCWDFKEQCCNSDKILQNWKKNKSQDRPPLDQLYQKLPTKLSNEIETPTETIDTWDIKTENLSEPFDDKFQNKMDDDGEQNYVTEHLTEDFMSDEQVDEDDDNDDDKHLSEFLGVIKAENEWKESINTNDGMKVEMAKPLIKRKGSRKPLANQKEMENIFDIEIFATEADALREFSERCNSERYVNAKFKCDVCFTVYKCQKLVDYHMRWHRPSAGDLVCNVCFMRFKKYVSLQKHKNDVHFGLYKCKKCPLVTYYKMAMRHHFNKHQGVEYKCKHCDRVYRHSSTYMTHLRTRHWTEHVCVWCARTFVSEKGLLVHRNKVHPTETKIDPNDSTTATCYDCKITFVSEAVYTVHVLNTPKHRDFASAIIGCPECGQQFPCRLELRAHRRKLHPTYRNYGAMKHIEKNRLLRRSDDERLIECQLCGKSGTHNSWLYHHYQKLHPEIPYEQVRNKKLKHLCEECGRSFLTSTALKEHQNLHSGIQPFTCDKCPAKFRRKTSLTVHLQRHLPPTRECKHCGKKFVSASNLSNHMRAHIGDRRYKCTICSKDFLHSASLNEHVRGVHHHIRRTRKNVTKTVE